MPEEKVIDIRDAIVQTNQATQGANLSIWKKNFRENKEKHLAQYTSCDVAALARRLNIGGGWAGWFFGAGATVDENISKWKKYNRGEPVIACDAVFRNLMLNGIVPDVVVSADGGGTISQFFDGIEIDLKTALLCSVFANPTVVDRFAGRAFFFHLFDDMGTYEWFYGRWNHSVKAAAMGNVGNVMLTLMRFLGCKQFWCIGYDFCYLDLRPYCKNVRGPGKPAKVSKEGLVKHSDTKLYTTKHLAMFYQTLVDVWQKNPKVTEVILNVTGKGLLGVGGFSKLRMSSWAEYQKLGEKR